MDQLFRGFA